MIRDCDPCKDKSLVYISDKNCFTLLFGLSRLIFQKRSAAPIETDGSGGGQITDKTHWATLLDKTNTTDDAAVITPRNALVKMAIETPDPVTTTDTTDGSEIILGTVAKPQLKGIVKNLSPTQYKAMRALNCMNLKFFIVNVNGQIWAKKVDATHVTGFSVKPSSFYLQSLTHDGSPLAQSDFPLRLAFESLYWYENAENFDAPFLNDYLAG